MRRGVDPSRPFANDQPDAIRSVFDTLRQSIDPAVISVLQTLVSEGHDADLARINPLSLARDCGLGEDSAIAALLHATRLGLFDMVWNILCPSCRGTLDSNARLRDLRHDSYRCAFCAIDADPVLDDTVEVSFTVSPRVRRIAAHDPGGLDFWSYWAQVFFSTGLALVASEGFMSRFRAVVGEALEIPAADQRSISLQLDGEPIIIFDPVAHEAHFVTVEDQAAVEAQHLTVILSGRRGSIGRSDFRRGALTVLIENRTDRRTLPGVILAGPALFAMLKGRQPHLTAKRLLSNQVFRDLYRTDTLNVDQRFKVANLTFVFTDLRGSTELYERVGDFAAYDLVLAHFRLLSAIVAEEGGAVVKTIGDAVMATFPEPGKGLRAALRMRGAVRDLNDQRDGGRLALKIGVHAGPCLAVNLNDGQDYFGQTINIAARVQSQATADAILITDCVATEAACAGLLASLPREASSRDVTLRGVGGPMIIHELR